MVLKGGKQGKFWSSCVLIGTKHVNLGSNWVLLDTKNVNMGLNCVNRCMTHPIWIKLSAPRYKLG